MASQIDNKTWFVIIIAALGYFVDVYDILLFPAIRSASLTAIGVPAEQLLSTGLMLLNWQMAGLLLGGIFWGIWGDKKGRVSVLFASIALYSIANLLNAFVTDVQTYALLRFFAGLGLAGELGAGVTLVSEMVPKAKRGIATMVIAGVGGLGGIAAALAGLFLDWQTAFIAGGIGGLVLLLLRVRAFESGLFTKLRAQSDVKRGNLLVLFKSPERIWRYLLAILSGAPVYFAMGIIVVATPELGKLGGLSPAPVAAWSLMAFMLAFCLGDIVCSSLSQVLKSRRKALIIFNALLLLACVFFALVPSPNLTFFYFKTGLVGFAVGLWAVLNTAAAEQFGTNLRATVATTVPNFVRGLLIPITMLFAALKSAFGLSHGLLITGIVVALTGVAASALQKETFHKDLDYIDL